MTQPNAKEVLSVLCAPALVCTAAGSIVAMNQSAADCLGTSSTIVAGQRLSELICTPNESLDAFLHRAVDFLEIPHIAAELLAGLCQIEKVLN